MGYFFISFLGIFIFQICLGDSTLVIEVERDYTVYGDELKFGGGKVIHCSYLQAHYCNIIIIIIIYCLILKTRSRTLYHVFLTRLTHLIKILKLLQITFSFFKCDKTWLFSPLSEMQSIPVHLLP